MRKLIPVGIVLAVSLGGCGLENLFSGLAHQPHDRPASTIKGAAAWQGAAPYQFQVVDANGKALEPFWLTASGGAYEVRLPSSNYSMVRAQARAGQLLLRALVPYLGPESTVSSVDLDARGMAEELIVEANLSITGQSLALLNPSAYDDPVTGEGTRKQIRAAFDVPGPTQDLLQMVERVIAKGDPLSGDPEPGFFFTPTNATGVLTIGGGSDLPFTDGASLTVGGYALVAGTDFVPGSDDAASAKAIAEAITAHPALGPLVVAGFSQGGKTVDSTVHLRARQLSEPGNAITTTTTASSASWGGAALTGGASPLSATWLTNQATFGNGVDYTGDGTVDVTTTAFDALLGQVALLYKPEGCPDDTRIRLVFTVDFNQGCISGSCGPLNRFLWTTDKPGKHMYFVGWIHKQSDIQDPAVGQMLGNSVPNVVPMYDDGTNGDETAGDGVYTIFFDVPRDPAGLMKLRIGYKYTWGFQGQPWSGSEEWPGNSRIIQVDDMNGDGFVYRRDVYQDEASNKDAANLNPRGNGTLGWDTDLRGCGIPEAREQKFVNVTPGNMCSCSGDFYTPPNLSPINAACK